MALEASSRLDTEQFWSANQPGFRFAREEHGTPEFFVAVERHRYQLEPHIPAVVQFDRWREQDVLEVGCGIATDGISFARRGARYTGADQSPAALALARRRFELEGLTASFVESRADALPFPDESFDLVFSHGVIHHMQNPKAAVAEFHRLLRPGGTALVMVYHRRSFNYYVSIMTVRRALAALLVLPGAPLLIARATRESSAVLEGQRALLRDHGLRYLTDRTLFLSNNTDGPGNPLSKVFSREQAKQMFCGFTDLRTCVRYLNLRAYPGGGRVARTSLARRLESRIGWHLYISAVKR